MAFLDQNFFFTLALILLYSSVGHSQQSLVFIYSEGSTVSTTPYLKVEHMEKNLGSIGIGEYLTEFSEKGITSFHFTRQGLGTKTININIKEDITFIKTIIKDGRWSLLQLTQSEMPAQIRSLCHSLISENKFEDEQALAHDVSSSYFASSGVSPTSQSSIVLMSNEIDMCCNSSKDLILDMISIGLSDKYNLIDRTQLASIIEEQRLQLSGLTNDDIAIEAGMIVGAQYSVIANCSCMDGGPSYSIKFINCETSEVSYSAIFQTETLSMVPDVLKSKLE